MLTQGFLLGTDVAEPCLLDLFLSWQLFIAASHVDASWEAHWGVGDRTEKEVDLERVPIRQRQTRDDGTDR